ncbi:MAG: endonuclease [Bdellovibrionaceae bacterium]|nr:endonuclease [Pseudobdellovibrionaceae bacterium]
MRLRGCNITPKQKWRTRMKKNFIKTVILLPIVLSFFCVAQGAMLSEKIPYYGEKFYEELHGGAQDNGLLIRLKAVLKGYHMTRKGQLDEIGASCTGNCYIHTSIGYRGARYFLLSDFYLIKMPNGYGVHDVYCHRDVTPEDFKRGNGAGPNRLPDDTVVNVEHTWPQSKFTGRHPIDTQKSDLHHLFPTNSKTNSIRGNNPFGEVERDLQDLDCKNVRTGYASGGREEIFEPPQEHKGNVARALFYFATRYDMQIDSQQEVFLKKWHKEDPVDETEQIRNQRIFELQNVRNPFIDYPDLVDKVENF